MAADIGPILDCFRSLYIPLSTEIGYVRNFEKYVMELKKKTSDLTATALDTWTVLNAAELNGEKPLNVVINWLDQVKKMEEEVTKIKKLEDRTRCWKGLVPNYNMRSKISKKSSSLTEEGKNLLDERDKLGNCLTFENQGLAQRLLSTPRILGNAMNLKKDEILKCILRKDQNGIIGIYGLPGTGKTSIMKNINNHLIESKDIHRIESKDKFDDILWVTVSKFSNVDELQKKIEEKLKIKLIGGAEEKQSQIFTNLTLRNKFLLILDDVWAAFPLDEVGIPHPSETNGCKIVLTTRQKAVCTAMGAHTIKVDTLSVDESWDLFKRSMGDVKLHTNVEELAKGVAKQCCGLPLAILTVGKAMSCEPNNVKKWENTLEKLEEAKLDEEGLKDVFSRLKFSYTQLPKDIVQPCFLYCSLYPQEYEIPTVELIDYWICEGLIDEQGTRKDAVDKGYAVLDELINSSMLELSQSGGGYGRVKMHDLIREMAIQITKEEGPLSFTNAGVKLEDWTEDAQRISLMHSHIENLEKLLDIPKSSKLLTLLLQENPLNDIPDSYFDQMCLLKVLDLSGTKIKSLPKSISNLKDLRALLLRKCRLLKEVSSLSKLDQLRLLDLSETSIQELPAGMKAMVKLQRLNLNGTRELHLFPAGIISELPRLEELTMCSSRWTWSEMKGEGATIDEIMKSNKLVNLDIDFKDLSNFLCYINSGKWQILKSFRLGISSLNLEVDGTSQRKFIVEISGCYLIDLILDENYLLIPKNTKWLDITYCRMICLCHFTCLLSNTELHGCRIYRCNEMEFLMAESEEACDEQFLKVKGEEARNEMLVLMAKRARAAKRERVLLPNLKYLIIQSAFLLRDLCRGIPSQGAFENLESLIVDDCNNLEYLFPARLLQQLRSLKHVEVLSCSEMEEIVREEEEMKKARNDDKNTTELSQLQTIKMWRLPNLTSICSSVLICNALETVDVRGCPEMKKLPFSVHNLPCALRKIIGGDEWWNALECNDSETKDYFQPFQECP